MRLEMIEMIGMGGKETLKNSSQQKMLGKKTESVMVFLTSESKV